ncbi:hypothetical protein BN1012_Phect1298 [Candidatus Phaeomarinobacter ectocarpi]|uniref:Uncharacterized protein n=1 Tax=Candidatus Phaeomarinibacter ectocarpi TaxID=1458461 RepID=X5MCT0_9HYPH|nr:hypothetical protein BN1012_Phect1298 [Candidatus Phaeomarinobacter ectocarpi]
MIPIMYTDLENPYRHFHTDMKPTQEKFVTAIVLQPAGGPTG